jgi:ATP adenylyltransferase
VRSNDVKSRTRLGLARAAILAIQGFGWFQPNRVLTSPGPTLVCPAAPMQQLHSYWRMSYIEAPRPAQHGRLFSELPALGDDRAALILHRSRRSYLVLNKFPYNPGHLLAVPFRAATDLGQLTPAERADLMEEIALGQAVLRAASRPDGFNIGFNFGAAAGSSIPHLHAHIVPRWTGDTNFMPVIGQTRILPQALAATYERLREVLPRVLAGHRPGKKRAAARRARKAR